MIAGNENLEPAEPVVIPLVKRAGIGRNDPCPCNSGEKYKHCHEKSDMMLLPREMRALFHLLVIGVKGVAITQKKLDEYPEDAEMICTYDAEKQIWFFTVPATEPKLILHKKRIIMPN